MSSRPLVALFALPLLLFACLPETFARGYPNGHPLVRMDVVDRDGGRGSPPILERHWHRGSHWIAGEPGHRYSVRLTNTTGERVLVVLSIDGVNAVSGETADPSQAGYVLDPWQSTEVHGWRKSLDDVAQFVFTDLSDSYAARTGRPDNVGVIGIAVFREASAYRDEVAIAGRERRRQAERSAAASRAEPPAAADAEHGAQPAPQQLGTGHGDREWSPVTRTGFVRASRSPVQVTQVRYDDRRSLVARGVLPRWPRQRAWDAPEAFPNAFVPDPPR